MEWLVTFHFVARKQRADRKGGSQISRSVPFDFLLKKGYTP